MTAFRLQILLQEDSDHYDTYTSADRSEFIFRLFKHLVLGGPVNQVWPICSTVFSTLMCSLVLCVQYEDAIQPYLDIAKLLYKELLTWAPPLSIAWTSLLTRAPPLSVACIWTSLLTWTPPLSVSWTNRATLWAPPIILHGIIPTPISSSL